MKVSHRRKAVAGIVAAVILFAMLFTVGTGFFMFTNSQFARQQSASRNADQALSTQLHESLLLTTSQPGSDIVVGVTNSGGSGSNITGIFVMNLASGQLLQGPTFKTPATNPALPVFLNVGATVSIDTGVQFVSGNNYAIKVLTRAGNVFSTTYPPTATSLAAQALSSGAIGDLYLNFRSYTFYTVKTGINCPSPAPTGASSYCVGFPGSSSFAIPVSYTNQPVVFSVQVTDYNPNQANIVLDQYSFFAQLLFHGTNVGYATWFIVNVTSTYIMNYYTPIVLKYNVPVTLFFAMGSPVCQPGQTDGTGGCNQVSKNAITQPNGGGSSLLSSGTEEAVFIISHGCEAIGQTACSANSANYGQNSPYVTTLYY